MINFKVFVAFQGREMFSDCSCISLLNGSRNLGQETETSKFSFHPKRTVLQPAISNNIAFGILVNEPTSIKSKRFEQCSGFATDLSMFGNLCICSVGIINRKLQTVRFAVFRRRGVCTPINTRGNNNRNGQYLYCFSNSLE
jgi:hypothetical protein